MAKRLGFCGFNGAATLSLRKCTTSTTKHIHLQSLQWGRNFIVAEISIVLNVGKGRFALLQWGRNFIVAEMTVITNHDVRAEKGFNGAATLSLRKCEQNPCTIRQGNTLQWGRNFIVAEIQYITMPTKEEIHASMGPQLYRCGNRTIASLLISALAASMGPQLYRCGNLKKRGGVNVRWFASMGPQLYRCGNAARLYPWDHTSRRFNGAATLSLRKFQMFLYPAYLPSASMGPQLYRCGNRCIQRSGLPGV